MKLPGMVKPLSLRDRFLVAPAIGIAITFILYFSSNSIIHSQSELFKKLSESNLPQISQISQFTVLLVNNHSNLSFLLRSAIDEPDEERIYLEGRTILNNLHILENKLKQSIHQTIKQANQHIDLTSKIQQAFKRYRESTISAIELSTVDAKQAQQELLSADNYFRQLTALFIVLSDYHTKKLTTQARLIKNTLFNQDTVTLLAIVLLSMMMFSAFYFSKHLSADLDRINQALIDLSEDRLDITLPERDNNQMLPLASAVYKFKQSIEKNRGHQKTLNQTIEKLRISEERHANLLNIVATGIIAIDDSQKIILFNKAAEKIFGYQTHEIIGQPLSVLIPEKHHHQHKIQVDAFEASSANTLTERKPLPGVKKNGDLIYVDTNISKINLADKTIITAAVTDVTERLRIEEKILHQAHYDALTQLPNRFLSLDRLSNMMLDAKRQRKLLAVLFLDLDDFKKVNDTLGHETGDKVLIEASERLLGVLRKGDTVGRLGGDEFIILLPDLNDIIDVIPALDNLINQFRIPFKIDNRELILTASIGVSIFPEDGSTASELLRNADSAMYNSKDLGRNTYSYFTEKLNTKVSRQLSIEEQMHGALERNEFYVLYQPQVDIHSNRIIGTEALVRWNNPTLGQIFPEEFIPIAERTGLIVSLGQFVLSNALKATAEWQKTYDAYFHISVNLSPRQFRDPQLVSTIQMALHNTGVSAHTLELEITEGVLMSGHKHIQIALSALSKLGISLAMDDFGTGYSSLSYLRNYPFNTLKIDRSFIMDITIDPADKELVNATIAMAHGLDLKVVAEGVETREQLNHIKSQGCEIAQGYFFSKPVAAGEIAALLINQA